MLFFVVDAILWHTQTHWLTLGGVRTGDGICFHCATILVRTRWVLKCVVILGSDCSSFERFFFIKYFRKEMPQHVLVSISPVSCSRCNIVLFFQRPTFPWVFAFSPSQARILSSNRSQNFNIHKNYFNTRILSYPSPSFNGIEICVKKGSLNKQEMCKYNKWFLVKFHEKIR
jgi:hypothetical protein